MENMPKIVRPVYIGGDDNLTNPVPPVKMFELWCVERNVSCV